MKKLIALMIFPVLVLAQNPQSIQFPKGIKTDSIFSLNAASVLFRVEAGRTVLKLFDDSVSFYAGNVHAGFLTTTGLSLIHGTKPTARLNLPASDSVGNIPPLRFTDGKLTDTPQTLALETDGDSLYFTPNDGVRRALSLAAIDTTGGGGVAGGWVRTDKIYTDTAGVKVHVRAVAGDTTETRLFNVYGTSDFGNDVTFDADLYFKSTKIFEDSDTSLVNLSYKGASISTTYTDAKITSITGSLGVIALPTTGATKIRLDKLNIDSVGTIIKGVWTGSSIGTGYTDAKITSIVGSLGVIALPTTGDTKIRLNKTAIDTVGTLAAGSIPISLITGQGSMAYVDSTKYHGSASINTVGTITSGIWNAGAVTSSGDVTAKGGGLIAGEQATASGYVKFWDAGLTFYTQLNGNIGGGNVNVNMPTSSGTLMLLADTLSLSQRINLKLNTASVGSMAYVDSTKYHGSASINTVGTITSGTWSAGAVTSSGDVTAKGGGLIAGEQATAAGYVKFWDAALTFYTQLNGNIGGGNVSVNMPTSSGTLALTSDIPSYETDPSIYTWAKAATKPTYTYSEVGAAASGHNHSGVYLPVSGAGDIYTHNASEFAVAAHNHSGVYLPVSGAGDIYTHNASEFAVAAHNHSGVYLPVSGAGDIYTHNASEFALTGHNHTGVYHPYVVGAYTGSFTVKDGAGDTMTLTFSNGIFTGYSY